MHCDHYDFEYEDALRFRFKEEQELREFCQNKKIMQLWLKDIIDQVYGITVHSNEEMDNAMQELAAFLGVNTPDHLPTATWRKHE